MSSSNQQRYALSKKVAIVVGAPAGLVAPSPRGWLVEAPRS
jgi:hypothetical protein